MIALYTWLTQVASFPSKNHLQSIVVIITITDIIINISIVAILCTVTVTYPYQDNHPIQSILYRPFKTCYRNIQFFFSPVCRLVPWQPACYTGLVALFTCLGSHLVRAVVGPTNGMIDRCDAVHSSPCTTMSANGGVCLPLTFTSC